MSDKDFYIAEDGTVVRKEQTEITSEENKEMLLLKEAVFRHPEHYSSQELDEKKKRLDEIWKKYGLEEEERGLLEYSVFVHPERCSAQELDNRKKRLDELWVKYGKQDDTALKLVRAKKKLELLGKEKSSDGNSVLKMAMMNLRKENQ